MNECHFCHKEQEGYARRDANGQYQDACYACAKEPYPAKPEPVETAAA